MASSAPLPPARFNILGHMMQINPSGPHSHLPINPRNPHIHSHTSSPRLGVISGANSTSASTSSSLSSSEDECPLDFSKKAKKLPPNPSSQQDHEDEENLEVDVDVDVEDVDLSSRRLRTALSLSMKSPSEILNLSSNSVKDLVAGGEEKHSPMSQSSSRSWSRDSSPGSPSPTSRSPTGDQSHTRQQQLLQQQHNQQLSLNQLNLPLSAFGGGNGTGYPLQFSPWGSSPFSQSTLNLSPGSAGLGLDLQQQQHRQLLGFTSPAFAGVSPPVMATVTAQMQGQGQGQQGSGPAKVRVTRPFKAYPKDPMSFPSVGMYGLPNGADALLQQQSHQAYSEFRKQMLASSQMDRTRRASSHKGSSEEGQGGGPFGRNSADRDLLPLEDQLSMSTPPSKRSGTNVVTTGGKSEQQMKDEAYWERRRKNNEAAKRSRDARRAKEDEIAIRAAFLERENISLRYELSVVKDEVAKLRAYYSRSPRDELGGHVI